MSENFEKNLTPESQQEAKDKSALEIAKSLDLSTDADRAKLEEILSPLKHAPISGEPQPVFKDESGNSHFGTKVEISDKKMSSWRIKEDWSPEVCLAWLCSERLNPEVKAEIANTEDYNEIRSYFGHTLCKRGWEFGVFNNHGGELFSALSTASMRYLAQSLNSSYLTLFLSESAAGGKKDYKEIREYALNEFTKTDTWKLLNELVKKTLDLVEDIDNLAFDYVQKILQDKDFKLPPASKDGNYQDQVEKMKEYNEKMQQDYRLGDIIAEARRSGEYKDFGRELPEDKIEEIKKVMSDFEGEKRDAKVQEELRKRIEAIDEFQKILAQYYKEPTENS